MNAWIMRAVCVPMRTRRLGSRSAMAPAMKARQSMGADWRAVTSPSLNGELVSSRTSHDCATRCIHVPMSETSCPEKKRR